MSRSAVLLYGVVSYVVFFGTFLYAIGFLGNFAVPKSIDSGVEGAFGTALLINLLLLSLFAIQHTPMARPAFKKRWTQFVPEPIERSTYTLLSSLILILLFWQWRPMTGSVWSIESPVGSAIMWSFYGLGWVILLVSTFIIDHFDLFGLRQVVLYFLKKPYTPPEFQSRLFYKFIRHPLMLGWLVIFWSTPQMTVGHLVFAVTTTIYILIAIQIEERDLLKMHGDDYAEYRRNVSMLVPLPKGKGAR
jgi:protein-S-isoprenylcysteine O-methyltransferase Ste14